MEKLVPWGSDMNVNVIPIKHQSKNSLLRFIASRYPEVKSSSNRKELETLASNIIANNVPPIPSDITLGDYVSSRSWVPVNLRTNRRLPPNSRCRHWFGSCFPTFPGTFFQFRTRIRLVVVTSNFYITTSTRTHGPTRQLPAS